MDDVQFRHVFPVLPGPRRRQDILHHLAAHPDWFILGTTGDATGFAILVTHLPTRSHGSVWFHGVETDRFVLMSVRCADDERCSGASPGDA